MHGNKGCLQPRKKETLNIKYTTASPCIIKQVIRMYVPYSRPNGWTEWADIF